MARAVDALLRKLTRTGFRRGLGGGHWAWFVVAGAAFLLQRARRPDDAVARLDLEPGHRYVVSLLEPGAPGGADDRRAG
jgi:hypothetical protein